MSEPATWLRKKRSRTFSELEDYDDTLDFYARLGVPRLAITKCLTQYSVSVTTSNQGFLTERRPEITYQAFNLVTDAVALGSMKCHTRRHMYYHKYELAVNAHAELADAEFWDHVSDENCTPPGAKTEAMIFHMPRQHIPSTRPQALLLPRGKLASARLRLRWPNPIEEHIVPEVRPRLTTPEQATFQVPANFVIPYKGMGLRSGFCKSPIQLD
ncbi:hypothetical protein BC832DRAFT_542005 [Gaertneriomyces semiglobifer]|nr:hypothetical protein BC832DRAFT_542005 [Gaertneriomyces semiglobifer]